jgi:DNA invertase Pin-like site-specific DNA recombinase
MQRAALKVDLVPTDCHEFGYAQPVPEGYEDQHRVARSVPPGLGGSGDQPLDLGRGQVLATAAFQVGHATRRLYLRVSTNGQTVDNQRRELIAVAKRHGWNVAAEFVDHGISGSKGRDKRPQYDALCAGIGRKDFDRVAAWSVDRIGRSLPDLVVFLEELRAKGIDLYLHQQTLDTATPSGRMVFGMCSVFAAFEREMIIERVNAGLARARERGITLGRPTLEHRKDWPKIERRIRELRADGMGVVKIGRTLKIGTSVVQRILAP